MKRLRRPRLLFFYPLGVVLVLVGRTSEASLVSGAVIALLGCALRLWANGYVGDRKVNETPTPGQDPTVGRLVTAGPYARVRNPLYVGTLLIGVGLFIAVGSLWLGAVGFVLFVALYQRKILSEETLLRRECGGEFERYAGAVPRWVPALRGYADAHGRWSWQGVLASQELKTLAWVIVALILAYFREEFIQEREPLEHLRSPKHLALLAAGAALMLADGVYELIRRSRLATPKAGRL
jgi:protein-S-isoprenylcysteine O-methyltransferase Ste14